MPTGLALAGLACVAFCVVAAQPVQAVSQSVSEKDLIIPDTSAPAAGSSAGAAGTGGVAPAAAAPAVSSWDFVRMILVLAAVVGAIYLLFWFLRRGMGKKIQENDLIKVLGSRSLSGNRALHLVEVGRSVYLVGSADGGVDLIAEVTEKETLDTIRLKAAEEEGRPRRSFQAILSDLIKPSRQGPQPGDGAGFLRRQRDRLKKL
jgi:flagellar protein FliO/FliZ